MRLVIDLFLLSIVSIVGNGAILVSVCFSVEEKPINNALVECFSSHPILPDKQIGSGFLRNGCINIVSNRSRARDDLDVYCRALPNGDGFAGISTVHNPRRIATKSPGCLVEENATNAKSFRRSLWQESSLDFSIDLGWIDLPVDPDYSVGFKAMHDACGPAYSPLWFRNFTTAFSGFTAPCSAHDSCYDSCNMRRSQCDRKFALDMKQLCGRFQWKCRLLASSYSWVVHKFGKAPCEAARERMGCTSNKLCSE